MNLSLLNWFLAMTPILVLLVLMLVFHWGGSRAGMASWFFSILVSVLAFGAGPHVLITAQAKSVLLTLDVLYIIWMALLLFHVANEAGVVSIIGNAISGLTRDRTMQGLLLGWVFASFLQGMGGFGVPVAVTAPLLVGLGFHPIQSVVMASIGYGWAINFGSMATSFQAMLAVTGLPGEYLAPDSALLLGLAALPCGGMVAYIAGGWKGLRHTLPAVIILSAVMGTTQYILATNGLWVLGATGGSMAGLVVGVLLSRLPRYRTLSKEKEDGAILQRKQSLLQAVSAYVILILLAFGINLIPAAREFMNRVSVSMAFPAVTTSYGWEIPAEMGRDISLFGHPGAILLYSSLIAFFVYDRAGFYQPGAWNRILKRVVKGAVNSSLGIVTMVAMAVIMYHSGMTSLLALGLSEGFGQAFYPFISPFIGALGAFITGSNNNSAVLFAALQMETAEFLGLSVPVILAAQSTGGSLGSIMAPAKVIVGCSTVGLGGQEGEVIRRILGYGLLLILFTSLVVVFLVNV